MERGSADRARARVIPGGLLGWRQADRELVAMPMGGADDLTDEKKKAANDGGEPSMLLARLQATHGHG
jgi:hypothetical protein